MTDGTGTHGFQWRADGRLDREVFADGGALLYGYDAAGRRTGYAFADGTAGGYATWGGWGYDAVTGRLSGVSTPERWVDQSYHPATGQVGTTTVGGATAMPLAIERSYDGLGRVDRMRLLRGEGGVPDLARTYAYNDKGKRETLAEESGETWHFDYNKRGEVKQGVKVSGTLAFEATNREYRYDAIGNRTELKVGSLAFNDWTANALNQIESREVEGKQYVTGKAATPALVTVTAQAETGANAPTVDPVLRTDSYFSAKINTKNATQAKNLKITVTEQVAGQTPHDTTGHLFVPASPEMFGYDDDGNRTQDGRWEYTFDAENRLIEAKTRAGLNAAGPDPLPLVRLAFTYDAFDRRMSKAVTTQEPGHLLSHLSDHALCVRWLELDRRMGTGDRRRHPRTVRVSAHTSLGPRPERHPAGCGRRGRSRADTASLNPQLSTLNLRCSRL